ncbi:hypothetical protein GQ54DRAFT_284053 [Martensiomyces pterosporus]|nr:hypothetical protein GQ54DRAFT_284053 [Martensiomyces pterosporus]
MAIDSPNIPKRVASIKEEVPKQRKRSRTGGSKDLYEGHSQDVMLAKTLIDPDHQCSVTTVKAYVTHVCAWFRYCRTLPEPNYTLVNEEKLSGFLTWATQTPRLPCKTGGSGSGGSMSYQSARRYVEGGILALWRRYKRPDDENPLHALSYLNTKYAIREATANGKPKSQPERHYSALAVSQDQEEAIVRSLLASDLGAAASIRAWAFYCLGASTWIPGARRLHLRLDSLVMSLRTDARLVEHTTIPFLEFRVNPDPASPTARFAEVSIARHINPLLCPWYAISLLVFLQWQAQPSAMATASLYDLSTWLSQPLFLANTDDSLVFLSDDTRVQMVLDEVLPILTQAQSKVKATPESHIIRRRDKMMAESLGLSAPQVVRLEKWRVHHRRPGITRQQTFFDLTLVLGGQNPPPAQTDVSHTFRAPSRTRLQVPDHLLSQVFPWLAADEYKDDHPRPHTKPQQFVPSTNGVAFVSRQRSHSMSAGHSDDVARAERNASLRLMRELATVLLQDSAALLADPQYAPIVEAHPLFQAPLFRSRAFRDFCTYATQALSLQHIDIYSQNAALPRQRQKQQIPPLPLSTSHHHHHHHHMSAFSTTSFTLLSPSPTQTAFPGLHGHQPTGISPSSLLSMPKPEPPTFIGPTPFPSTPLGRGRRRGGTFEAIGEEEDPIALMNATAAAGSSTLGVPQATAAAFNPMLLSQPLPFPPQLNPTPPNTAAVAFPQLLEDSLDQQQEAAAMSQQDFLQLIDYLSAYNQQQPQGAMGHTASSAQQTLFTGIAPSSSFPQLPTASAVAASSSSAVAGTAAVDDSTAHATVSQHATTTGTTPSQSSAAGGSDSTTASPELTSTSSNGYHKQQQQLANDPMLLGTTQGSLDAIALDDPTSLSMYLNATTALVDPSALVQLTPTMALPKTADAKPLMGSSSPNSTSPTPTPSSSSPSLHPADPAAALQFSIAPYKLQFKADHDLFLH